MKLNFAKAAIESLPPPAKGWAYHYDTKTRGLAIGISHTGARSFVVYRKVLGKPERITLGRYPASPSSRHGARRRPSILPLRTGRTPRTRGVKTARK